MKWKITYVRICKVQAIPCCLLVNFAILAALFLLLKTRLENDELESNWKMDCTG